MYQPTPADFDETVALSLARGIDPHDVTLVLWIESAGYNPASMGPSGNGSASGLNQMIPGNLSTYGFTPATWTALSAAGQLPTIFRFWDGLAKTFNAGVFPKNAAQLAGLNFVPDYYRQAGASQNPDAPIVSANSTDPAKAADYRDNVFYDPKKTGSITVNTIATQQAAQKAAGQ